VKGDRRAAAGRLAPLVSRYPLYSNSDEALWMLGDLFEKSERKDVAGGYYMLLVKNYPLSKKAPLAKDKLKAFGVPIPQPDAKALAWMTAEQNAPRPKDTPVHRAMGVLHNAPDVHKTAYSGNPQMEPESDTGGTDTLSGGNRTTLVSGSSGSSSSSTAVVETVKPGDPAPAKAAGAEDTTSGTAGDSSSGASTTNSEGSTAGATDAATTEPAKTDGTTTDSAATDATKTAAPTADANNNQKESSSKKKGVKKLIPW